MISLSLMISYIKHRQYSAKSKYFGPFYYIQIHPQDYDEWHTSPPEEEIHFQTPSNSGSPTTPQSTVSSEASESYITLTNFKKGIKRDASAYPIFKNERYYNTFTRHFKATAKAQGLNSLMDPNFTPGSDEHEQQLFQEQQDFLYSVLISSLKTEFSEALVKDHEGDAQLILELLHEHHTGNSQYSRAEINRITKYLTNIKLDDTWRGTNESFLMHYNDQLRLLDSLVDSGENLPDNARVTFLESAIESVPDLQRVKITDNVLQAQLGSTRPISYRSYFDLLKDAAFHLDQELKEETRYDIQMYTSLGPMMKMHTKPYPLMTIKSFSKRMFAVSLLNPCATHCSRATSKAHPHPTLRRSSFPNLSGKSSPKINNK